MRTSTRTRLDPVSVQLLLALASAAAAWAQPTFDKTFDPDIIGPGSVSTLRFEISNGGAGPVSDLAFTDFLPAGVTIATPANALTDCEGAILGAAEGGTTIVFSDGGVAPFASCFVTVDVTSAAPGTHTNVSGDLTSSAGNSGSASGDLVVDVARPGFSKSFTPNPIVPGDTSTLTLTIDNTLSGADVDFLAFTDPLPDGLAVASPANASTDCTGGLFPTLVTAAPGSSSVALQFGFAEAATTCGVSVDVTAVSAGRQGNTTGDLGFSSDGFNFLSAGKAGAVLEVERRFLIKVFADDPVPPGGVVTLRFEITNFDRLNAATDITFTDDLDDTLSGLAALGLPQADPCGPGSQLSGTDVVALTGGNVAAEGSCTFDAQLQVPAGAVPGSYLNTTSPVVADVGGVVVVEDPATDELVVAAVPILTKSFIDDPVTAGDSVTLRFTVTNTSPTESASEITFADILFNGLPSAAATPGADPCGAGSSATFTPPVDSSPARIDLFDGVLDPADSCTFDFVLDVDDAMATGTYLNTTGDVSATVDGSPVAGTGASDGLQVVTAPDLRKEFTDDPVLPGGTVTLQFTLELDAESPGDATDIAFTDDLGAALTGLEAVGLPIDDVCGAGSQLSGTSVLSLAGGTLSPGESCTFSATLQVPAGILPGDHTNTTSTVTAMALGLPVASSAATGVLQIGGLTLSKTFTDDPVVAGATVTLEFTLDNLSQVASAAGLTFTDDLDDDLAGLVGLGLPLADPCGPGSSLTGSDGNTLLVFQDGVLDPLDSCTFSVTLQVPGAAPEGDYGNLTSPLIGFVGGSPVTVDGASDILTVEKPLSIAKLFVDDPVPPGGSVILRFTLANTSADAIAGIAFNDDLDAALAGLAAVGLPANDVCGAGSQIAGTTLLSFTEGGLAPDSSCTFDVTVEVPPDTAAGTTAVNTTTGVTGTIGGLGTSGDPATDDLEVDAPVCAAADGESLTLQNDTVVGPLSFEVCDTIELGPEYQVAGPNGDLTLRAGRAVILRNGTSVGIDGTLRAGIAPDLQP